MVMASGQASYLGLHKYDGEHKNELFGYVMGGKNVVANFYGGVEVSYKRHLTDRWHVGADAQLQFGKQLYSVNVRCDLPDPGQHEREQ